MESEKKEGMFEDGRKSIYSQLENNRIAKHKGHNLGREYRLDADLDMSIRICKTCNVAVLFIDDR